MKKPSETSPFAALTSQEQKERWICWQSQKQQAMQTLAQEQTVEKTDCTSGLGVAKPTESLPRMQPHHSQYDAVLKRMQQAGRRVGQYVDCD